MNWPMWWNMSSDETTNGSQSGLLLIDKPTDFSSHDIIAIVRRILNIKKIGHSGTLDPMATGLLILLIGREATRQQARFLTLSKTYQAVLKLGTETDSWDAYGQVTGTAKIPPLTLEQVHKTTQALSGQVKQPIPFYSAKRIGGQRMYELARKGKEMEQKYNEVTVSWENVVLNAPDEISFTLQGSCGTYVRALGHLLAQKLGTVGHLTALRREAIGPYTVREAFDGKQLKQTAGEILQKRILPL